MTMMIMMIMIMMMIMMKIMFGICLVVGWERGYVIN